MTEEQPPSWLLGSKKLDKQAIHDLVQYGEDLKNLINKVHHFHARKQGMYFSPRELDLLYWTLKVVGSKKDDKNG